MLRVTVATRMRWPRPSA